MTDTGTSTDQQKPDQGDQGKTFTQAEVDAMILKRAERVAADKYGGDHADLQAKAKRLEEIEAANATELEKAVKKAKAEGAAEVQTAANTRLVAAEARALAAEAKFRNPTLAIKALDLSAVKVADDGSIDTAAIKAALKSLADDEPYLVDDGKKPAPKPDDAQGQPKGTPSKAEEGRAEARRRFGAPAGQTTQ